VLTHCRPKQANFLIAAAHRGKTHERRRANLRMLAASDRIDGAATSPPLSIGDAPTARAMWTTAP
jgi:hypothetical protein